MEDQVFQIQRMLADKLDVYRGKGNQYVNDNIWEIQKLYKNEKQEKELNKGKVEDKEVILIKPYKVLESTSLLELSFINDKVKNLMKYMKFIRSPIQTRIFRLPPHYQSLQSREKQNLEFWKKVATVLVEEKHNTKTARNGYLITMFQGGPLYKPYFIAIDNQGQVIIRPNKKTVATYVVGELEMLI